MGLRRFTYQLKTGNEKIRRIFRRRKFLEFIDSLPHQNVFWLSWYAEYVRKAGFSGFMPYSPCKNTKNRIASDAIRKITISDRVVCRDIILPVPENEDAYRFIMSLLENISTYLLEDFGPEISDTLHTAHPSPTEGSYEYTSVRLESGDILIDAGACVGEFSALAGVRGGRAYAFEPMPHVIERYLSKTAAWNPNITICRYALADKPGELIFNADPANSFGASSVNDKKKECRINVEAIDLDTFVERNKLPRVDFIKADIEGAERYMLMGAGRVLREFAPKISICTYHLPDDPEVLRDLILAANPRYVIEERWKKMYAYVPK